MWDKGWDQIFSNFEWGKYPGEDLIRFIARNFYKIKNRQSIKILEVGCGTGANIWFLSREGFTSYGIDGSKIAIDKASQYLENENLKADLRVGDAMKLPYEKSYFDAVIDVECIYANSLEDANLILQEIHRVLKPGGLLFSKTFGDKMSGQETATEVEGEKGTFLKMPDGPLRDGYGIIRLTSESQIEDLYAMFDEISYDYLYRTDSGGIKIVPEWIINAKKAD
tara:strand:+ start:365 stop:1036 length:672 start_codon:yes stop_codon:yes gene_type:complete